MRYRSLSALTVVLLASAACSKTGGDRSKPTAAAPAEWSVTPAPLVSPAGLGSSEPSLTTSRNGVLLSWVEGAGKKATLKFAERTSSGWSEVRTVASGDDWFLSWADVPSVLRLDNGALAASWLKNTKPEIEAYDLLLSYSKDEGKTWARPFTPHHDGTKTQHGFASMVDMPGAGLGIVWLDGRAQELDAASLDGGAMSLRFASFDASWKQTSDAAVDVKVCECCQTAAVVTTDGVVTAYRDRTDEEIRDIHVSRIDNGKWSDPTPVHQDNWNIPACPVNGPALSARGRSVAAAWFTVKGDQGQAYAAFSNDAGRSWGAPIRLDDAGSTGRVDIEMLDDGSAVATWVEFAEQRSQFRMRRVEPSGGKSKATTIGGGAQGRPSGHPRIARHGDELFFAWTGSASGEEGDSAQKIETATARLP